MEEEKITPVALVMCKTFNSVTNDLLHVAPVYGFFDGDDAVSYFDDMEKTFKDYVGKDGKKLDVKRINSETLHVDFENSDGLKGKNIYYLEIIKVF